MLRLHSENEKAFLLANEVGEQLLARLALTLAQPKVMVSLGAGINTLTQALQKCYPDATLLIPDAQLPLPDHSVDLIIANLILPWCNDLGVLFTEWQRALRPNGLLLFSSLGPDTLREWEFGDKLVPHFIDMHNIGDLLTQMQWSDPVLDVDYVTLSYREINTLFSDLEINGFLKSRETPLSSTKEKHLATYEVIYGSAWCPVPVSREIKIPLEQVRVTR